MTDQNSTKISPFLEHLNERAKTHSLEVTFHEDYETTDLDEILTQAIQPSPGQYLYHYTDQQGAFGILESKSIWASDPLFLNDKQEIRLGISALNKAFKKVKNDKPKIYEEVKTAHLHLTTFKDDAGEEFPGLLRQRAYTISFTTEPDDLSQWRGYGGASGVALGFELKLLEGARPKPFLAPMVYGTEDKFEDLLHEDLLYMLGKLDYEDSFNRIQALVIRYATFLPLMKHEAFQAENEWRVAVTGDRVGLQKAEWRSSPSYAIPYIEIALWKGGKQTPLFLEGEQAPSQPSGEPYQGCQAYLGPGADILAEHYFDSKLKFRYFRSSIPFRTQ